MLVPLAGFNKQATNPSANLETHARVLNTLGRARRCRALDCVRIKDVVTAANDANQLAVGEFSGHLGCALGAKNLHHAVAVVFFSSLFANALAFEICHLVRIQTIIAPFGRNNCFSSVMWTPSSFFPHIFAANKIQVFIIICSSLKATQLHSERKKNKRKWTTAKKLKNVCNCVGPLCCSEPVFCSTLSR